jgi:outer membrane protein TolC
MARLALFAALVLLQSGAAMAGEVNAVQIGHTGQHLHNSAGDQPKHYIMQEKELDRRLCRLMDDVDHLLVKLHAMPAETSGTDPVLRPIDKELGRLLDIALRHNPELDVPRSELAVLAAKTRQAGAATDPMLSFELMDTPAPIPVHIGDIEGTGMGIQLEQEFQSYGKRGLRRQIASKDEALKELDLAQMEQDLMLEVTAAYYELFGAVTKRRALGDNIELMKILVEMAQRKLAIGTTPQAAVLNAQVQESKMELMATELDAQIDQLYIKLAGLLGYPQGLDLRQELKFDAAYPLPPKVEWDNTKLVPEALKRYPKYQHQCLMREQQDLMVEMARREYFPDYMLMGRYEAAFGMDDSYSFEVTVPLFLHKQERQDAALQEQYAQKAVISDEAEAIAGSFISQLENLEVELGMHGKLVDLLRGGTVPQARLALESNIGGFSANMMDFSDLIMSQQSLLDQETDLEQNYIHILHTLADLHILTLGAFDPAQYYAPAEKPVHAVSAPMALGAQAAPSISAGAGILRQPESELIGPPAISGDSFVQDLKLPPKSEAKPVQGKPIEKVQQKEGAEDEFHKPFVPRKKK